MDINYDTGEAFCPHPATSTRYSYKTHKDILVGSIDHDNQPIVEAVLDLFEVKNIGMLPIGLGWNTTWKLATIEEVEADFKAKQKAKDDKFKRGEKTRKYYNKKTLEWANLTHENGKATLLEMGFTIDDSRERGFAYQSRFNSTLQHQEYYLQIPKDALIVESSPNPYSFVPYDAANPTILIHKIIGKHGIDKWKLAIETGTDKEYWEEKKKRESRHWNMDMHQVVALVGRDASGQLWGHRLPAHFKFRSLKSCDDFLLQKGKEDVVVEHT